MSFRRIALTSSSELTPLCCGSARHFLFPTGALYQRGKERIQSYELAGNAMSIRTKCGRTFDVQIFRQVVEASQNSKWLQAIQRSLQDDTEYVTMVREKGGAAADVKAMMKELGGDAGDDATFLEALRVRLLNDEKMSLSLCAMQEAYMRIRKHRDEQQSRRAASAMVGGERSDPMAVFKQMQKGDDYSPPLF